MKSCGLLHDLCRNLDCAEEEMRGLCGWLGMRCCPTGKKGSKHSRCFCDNNMKKHPGYHDECECLNEKCEFIEKKC